MPVTKAVIPAAGFGTRFLPATKSLPKEMLPVVDTPTIQHVVEECVQSGITDILIIIGRGKHAIEEHFSSSSELEMRASPETLPFVEILLQLNDAVCEVPFGSYPGNMPYEYYSDEQHLQSWLQVETRPEDYQDWVQRHIFEADGFDTYLTMCGGLPRLRELRNQELFP